MLICRNACNISARTAGLPIRNRRRISWDLDRRHSPLYNVLFKEGCLGHLADASNLHVF